EAAAPEEVEPAPLLLVQSRLDADLVPVLLDPQLDVLEKTLCALLARAAHDLVRNHLHLAGRARADARLAGDIAHPKPRHAVDLELALDGDLVGLALHVVAEERRAHGARDLLGIHADANAVRLEMQVPAGGALRAALLAVRMPSLTVALALLAARLVVLLGTLRAPVARSLAHGVGSPSRS